jgi:hypothetical protein
MGLTLQIYKHAQTRAQTVIPRVRRTIGWHKDTGKDVPIQGAFHVARTDGGGRDRPPPRDGHGGRQRLGPSRYPPRPAVQGGRNGNRPPPEGQRCCFARPDRNRGEYRPDIICDACRRSGHVEANCDVLAIALFIEKYKWDIPEEMKDKIESDWLA